MRSRVLIFLAAVVLFASGAIAATPTLVVRSDKPGGVYTTGEKITWTITVKDGTADDFKDARYRVMLNQLKETDKGKLDLSSGTATVDTTLTDPSAALLIIDATVQGKHARFLGGAIADPTGLKPSAPPPDDFDAFWNDKIEGLRAIPMNAQLEPADSGDPKVDYFKVTLDNINGTHVYGQLARPKGDAKVPAMLMVQFAGVYPLDKGAAVRRAAQGWMTFNIMAHDLPFDKDKAYYDDLSKTTLKDYIYIGGDDRDQSYFLRMYLGCVRSIDYLTQRPDWNGKTMVVTGVSQGGQQGLVTAGLCPAVTQVCVCVPAGCDQTGRDAGRQTGFPYYARHADDTKDPKLLEVGRYFDVANFTPKIKCDALVGCGLIDETCPAACVFAAFNEIPGKKEMVVCPLSDHHGYGGTQEPFMKRMWAVFDEIRKGHPTPLQSADAATQP